MNLKLSNSMVVAWLAIAGCSKAINHGDRDSLDPALDPREPGVRGLPEVPADSPIEVGELEAAGTPRALLGMRLSTDSAISEVVNADPSTAVDVLQQQIVTKGDEPVALVVELDAPTGTFTRTVLSDTRKTNFLSDLVLCQSNNIATFDPQCEAAVPAVLEYPTDGAITSAHWALSVIDEDTQLPVSTCAAASERRVDCLLPTGANASYLIVVSAYGFADLWDGTSGLGEQTLEGLRFTGTINADPDWQCTSWNKNTSGSTVYCSGRDQFVRFNALDTARLDFDPMTVRITANHTHTMTTSPALGWDAGDDDLPGPR